MSFVEDLPNMTPISELKALRAKHVSEETRKTMNRFFNLLTDLYVEHGSDPLMFRANDQDEYENYGCTWSVCKYSDIPVGIRIDTKKTRSICFNPETWELIRKQLSAEKMSVSFSPDRRWLYVNYSN